MTRSLRCIVLSACLAFAAGVNSPPARAADAALEDVLVTQVEGLVVVDTDGSVAELKLVTPVPGELGPALESRLRALHFVPVTIGGQPVRAKTAFVLGLAAHEKPGGGLSVNVDGIEFRAPKDGATVRADGERAPLTGGMFTPPRLPEELLRSGVPGGGVDVAVRFGTDGAVEEAAIVRSYMAGAGRRGSGRAKLMRQFDAAALVAARKWRANMPADGATRSAKERTSTILITYYTGSASAMPYATKGVWVPVQRSPKAPPPWLAGDAAEVDRIATAGGSADSGAFRLVAPLAGTPVM